MINYFFFKCQTILQHRDRRSYSSVSYASPAKSYYCTSCCCTYVVVLPTPTDLTRSGCLLLCHHRERLRGGQSISSHFAILATTPSPPSIDIIPHEQAASPLNSRQRRHSLNFILPGTWWSASALRQGSRYDRYRGVVTGYHKKCINAVLRRASGGRATYRLHHAINIPNLPSSARAKPATWNARRITNWIPHYTQIKHLTLRVYNTIVYKNTQIWGTP